MQEYLAKITEVKHLTLDMLELSAELIAPEVVSFSAGQGMQFNINSDWKFYHLACVPDHSRILKFCLSLKQPDAAAVDFFKKLKLGDEVNLKGPMGEFIFEKFNRNVFFAAAGAGVVPFVSIIPDLLSRGFEGQARLLFGVRHEEDVFYFDKFSHLSALYPNFKFIPTLSQPQSHWPGETGRVTTYLQATVEPYQDYIFYLSGSSDMVNDVKTILLKRGHKAEDIKLEILS